MRRSEIPHHSDEQVEEYVAKALTLATKATVDESLRPAVFTAACGLYSAKTITQVQLGQAPLGMVVPRG